jgi:hypothetical protein
MRGVRRDSSRVRVGVRVGVRDSLRGPHISLLLPIEQSLNIQKP